MPGALGQFLSVRTSGTINPTALVGLPMKCNLGLPLPRAAEGEHGFGEDRRRAAGAAREHLRVGASKAKRRADDAARADGSGATGRDSCGARCLRQLRSSGPHGRIRAGLQLAVRRSATLGRRCEPSGDAARRAS